MSDTAKDLPPEIRDQADLIEDGLTDEIEALEQLADEKEGVAAPGSVPKRPSDEAEPAPETL